MGYTTIADVRNLEGLPAPPDGPTDPQVQAAIDYASALIDAWCGQWFEPRARTYKLDGTGESMLILPEAPIISITAVKQLDDAGAVLQTYDPSTYRVYNRHLSGGPDDRRLPRIEYLQLGGYPDIYVFRSAWLGRVVWPLGQQNIQVEGQFGYTDYKGGSPVEGITPLAIARICRLLVLRYCWPAYSYGDAAEEAASRGRMKSEKTRDQSWDMAWPWDASTMGLTGIGAWTGDPEIDRVLMMYQVSVAQAMAFV